jgi:hypothetical protein
LPYLKLQIKFEASLYIASLIVAHNMKKIIGTSLLLLSAFFVQAQKNNSNDTITTNYQPSVLFSPLPYTEKGNEFHSDKGPPAPKY